jgi:hypothetical protein
MLLSLPRTYTLPFPSSVIFARQSISPRNLVNILRVTSTMETS